MKSLQQEQLGRYRILEELGRGAMGIVHKAEDPSLARVVALKVVELPPDAFDSQEYEARFYQEAKAAGSLNHPGIITIFDTGREGNWAYIAMELLDGTELRELMATDRLPLARVLDIAGQVATALEFAHKSGVVHRDIKPANIMVLHGDQAKIMDFGIARTRISTVETQVGMVLGSPKYMSPEQVVGRRVDHRSDIFSLGVMLFEMVAGISPYSGKDIAELMYSVVNTREARASQFNPAAPEMLDLIIAKALQKDVAARYQSAGELAADLATCRAALGDEVVNARTLGEATVPIGIDGGVPVQTNGDVSTSTMVLGVTNTVPTAFVPASGTESTQVTQATLPAERYDATTAQLHGSTANRLSSGQLLFSRQFNSAVALQRLADPSAEDVKKLSKISPSGKPVIGALSDTRNLVVTLMIVAATIGALAIALI